MALNGKYKGAQLTFTVNSVDYTAEGVSLQIVNEESDNDVTTFADAAVGGGRGWFLDLEVLQDYASTSLWTYLWNSAGTTGVAYLIKPYGNATATTDKPHFSGTLTLGPPPQFGGEAGGDTWTTEYRATLAAKPTKVTT